MEDEKQQFQEWLVAVKEEAVSKGSNKEIVDKALDGISVSHDILKLESSKPETTLTVAEYISKFVNDARVSKGSSSLAANLTRLHDVEAHFGVPAPIIVAIWGIESSYGAFTGRWDIIQALVTLAYGCEKESRAAFFRGELMHAFKIIEQGHGPSGDNSRLRGSWAGAMGQCQFMPSSFVKFAVDYDRDGRCDIWGSCADVFASIANYLGMHGWKQGSPVAQKVMLPSSIQPSALGLDVKKTFAEWKTNHDIHVSEDEPDSEIASLVAPDGLDGPAFLVFHNFNVLMSYNRYIRYALAVWELSRAISNKRQA